MKTITIRLPDVERAMLAEVQKVNRAYRDLRWTGFSGQAPSLTSEAGYRP